MVRAGGQWRNGSSVVGRALPRYMSAILRALVTVDFIGDSEVGGKILGGCVLSIRPGYQGAELALRGADGASAPRGSRWLARGGPVAVHGVRAQECARHTDKGRGRGRSRHASDFCQFPADAFFADDFSAVFFAPANSSARAGAL